MGEPMGEKEVRWFSLSLEQIIEDFIKTHVVEHFSHEYFVDIGKREVVFRLFGNKKPFRIKEPDLGHEPRQA